MDEDAPERHDLKLEVEDILIYERDPDEQLRPADWVAEAVVGAGWLILSYR